MIFNTRKEARAAMFRALDTLVDMDGDVKVSRCSHCYVVIHDSKSFIFEWRCEA